MQTSGRMPSFIATRTCLIYAKLPTIKRLRVCVHTRAATCSGPRSCRPCCAHPPCARLSPGPAGATSAAQGKYILTCLSCHRRLRASAWGARRSLQCMMHFHHSCDVLVQDSTPCKSPMEILSLCVCTKMCSSPIRHAPYRKVK